MDKWYLKWYSFEANIREYFKSLRKDQSLFDVTLATDDGQQIQAHKIILSAGSIFFRDIFEKSNHRNMLIYLKGISSTELEHITDFLYNGEASVAQEELKEFLEAGKELQVKGLQGELQGGQGHAPENNPGKDEESENICNEVDQENIPNTSEVLTNETFNPPINAASKMVGFNKNQDLDIQIEELIEKQGQGLWKCRVCGKIAKNKSKIKNHAETHIEGMSHACHICSKTYPNRPALKSHISAIHSEFFSCDVCEKSGMNRAALRNHKQKNHRRQAV